MSQGDAIAAQEFLEQVLRHDQALGNRRQEAHALNSLSHTEIKLGNYQAAAVWCEQSLQLARSIGSPLVEGLALCTLSVIDHELGSHDAAVTRSRYALAIFRAIGSRDLEGWALLTLGHALEGLQQYDEAAEQYNAARDLRREVFDPTEATEAQAGLADIALAEGSVDLAIAHVEEILAQLAKDSSGDGVAQPLRVYLTCFRVLAAAHDQRADTLLASAHGMLEERAVKIKDPDVQRRFRENIPHHREIAAAWAERHGSAGGD